MPIELFLRGIREFDQKTQIDITALLVSRIGRACSQA